MKFPASTPMLLDSAPIPASAPDLPPPTRTASVIDFRNEGHVETRIGRVHSKGRTASSFQVVFYDGSVARRDTVADQWRQPIEP